MMQNHTTIISILSGKGGTGKTLLTAVLGRALSREGFKVLIVDLDIFVRGLTILLSSYIQKHTLDYRGATVSDLLGSKRNEYPLSRMDILSLDHPGLAISRFFECDILQATRDIGEPLDYDEQMFADPSFTKEFLDRFLSVLRGKYDFVLLDCRAGIDSHVVTIASASDFVISVAEDDDVCLQANTNLINHLRYRQNIKNVFTLINKGRRITSYNELKEKSFQRTEFNYMGVIPFDIEVMEDFGKERFWSTVYETLYFRGLIDAWNYFAERNDLGKISVDKYRFPAAIFMGRKSGRLPLMQRMLRVYGIVFGLSGISIILYQQVYQRRLGTFDLVAYVLFILSILTSILSTSNFRKWVLGETDNPQEKLPSRREY